MIKTVLNMLAGAFMCALVGAAMALTGNPPVPSNGPGLTDGTWLNGLAGGLNQIYQSGLTATGSTQAGALQLVPGISQYEIDTVAASTGVALPACVAGAQVSIYNNGASTLTIYPSISNNLLTAAQDTINNLTSLSGGLASHVPEYFACAKNGVWSAK